MIIQNEAECRKCGDIIWSAHRHDYKKCSCGAIMVDGGMAYIRRGAADMNDIIERSMTLPDDVVKQCVEAVDWGKDTGRNSLGIALAVIRALRDNNLLDMEKFNGDD